MTSKSPEEVELARLEAEQALLTEEVIGAELKLETTRTELAQFRRHYHQTVGRLYAQLDALDAKIAALKAGKNPQDADLRTQADQARDRAQSSAEEAGIVERSPIPTPEITPELKQAYRKAASLMHPDRATTDAERQRRHRIMVQLNAAYERGDEPAIRRLVVQFGQDPEAVTGDDIGSRIVKAIRRISQCRRRLEEISSELVEMEASEIARLRTVVTEAEAMGGDPLSDLSKQLMELLSERQIGLLGAEAAWGMKFG